MFVQALTLAIFSSLSLADGLDVLHALEEKTSFALPTDSAIVQTFLADKRLQCPINVNRKKLAEAIIQPEIIDKMLKPAEKKSWSFYKTLFISPTRIDSGKIYLHEHMKSFRDMYRRYYVPSAVVASIIGVETSYGKNLGTDRMIDALSTLSFYYPSRASYFQSELIAYLNISCIMSEEHISMQGSYAGAFGIPQFMPSSHTSYARSLYGTKPDIITSHSDAIASVGNYLAIRGKWHKNQPIIKKLSAYEYKKLPEKIHQDQDTLYPLDATLCKTQHCPRLATAVWCPENDTCYWLYPNFKSIMTYNISKNYALAVALLAQKIS